MAGNLNQPRSLLRQTSFQAAGQNFGHRPASASATSGMGNEANFERATLVGRPSASGSLSNPLTRTFSEAILEDAFQDAADSSSGSPRRATRMDTEMMLDDTFEDLFGRPGGSKRPRTVTRRTTAEVLQEALHQSLTGDDEVARDELVEEKQEEEQEKDDDVPMREVDSQTTAGSSVFIHSDASTSSSIERLAGRQIVEISGSLAERGHTLAVSATGRLYATGADAFGQTLRGSSFPSFGYVEGLSHVRIVQAAAGEAHSICLTSSGRALSFGRNDVGQLGHGEEASSNFMARPRSMPFSTSEFGNIVTVSCGSDFSVLLTDYGVVMTCGAARSGSLGQSRIMQNSPALKPVPALSGVPIQSISAGHSHVGAVSSNGKLYSWGLNHHGQLGLSRKQVPFRAEAPTLVEHGGIITAISCGSNHTAIVTSLGKCACAGLGSSGQLGRGSFESSDAFKGVSGDGSFVGVKCGGTFTILLGKGDGSKADPKRVFAMGKMSPTASAISVPTLLDQAAESGNHIMGIAATSSSAYVMFSGGPRAIVRTGSMAPRATLAIGSIEALENAAGKDPKHLCELMKKLFGKYAALNVSMQGNASIARFFAVFGKLPPKDWAEVSEFISGTTHVQLASIVPRLTASEQVCGCAALLGFANLQPGSSHLDKLCNLLAGMEDSGLEALAGIVTGECSPNVLARHFIRPLVEHLSLGIKRSRNLPASGGSGEFCAKFVAKIRARWQEDGHAVAKGRIADSVYYSKVVSSIKDDFLARDYLAWLSESMGNGIAAPFTFCSYPFLLSAHAKRRVMRIEAKIAMQRSMQNAMARSFANMIRGDAAQESPYLAIMVRRSHLLADSVSIAGRLRDQDLKKPLKVRFAGEAGVDAGGVTKEFFQLISEQLFSPDYGMFVRVGPGNGTCWFSGIMYDGEGPFYLTGLLAGLAVYNGVILDIHFPTVIYKKLLGQPVGMDELHDLDPQLGRSLTQILSLDSADDVECLCQTFEVSFTGISGEEAKHELVEGGKDRDVTLDNRAEYVERYVRWYLEDRVAEQFNAFARGFTKVVDGRSLQLFSASELEQLVEGDPDLDFSAMEKHTIYEGFAGNEQHPTAKRFWRVLRQFSKEQKVMFLRFATSAGRAPIGGLGKLQPPFKLQRHGEKTHLPTAATCFNTLLLPDYSSDDEMKRMLITAIENCNGFGLE